MMIKEDQISRMERTGMKRRMIRLMALGMSVGMIVTADSSICTVPVYAAEIAGENETETDSSDAETENDEKPDGQPDADEDGKPDGQPGADEEGEPDGQPDAAGEEEPDRQPDNRDRTSGYGRCRFDYGKNSTGYGIDG